MDLEEVYYEKLFSVVKTLDKQHKFRVTSKNNNVDIKLFQSGFCLQKYIWVLKGNLKIAVI